MANSQDKRRNGLAARLLCLAAGVVVTSGLAWAAAAPAATKATALIQTASAPASQPAGPLRLARSAMQDRQWEQALAALDRHLADQPKDVDEAMYLKALVLHYAGRHEAAVAAADRLN